jgi:hypothetical protein
MTSVHFRTADLDLHLRGSESFVLRQLNLLAPGLGAVDRDALGALPPPAARAPLSAKTEAAPPGAAGATTADFDAAPATVDAGARMAVAEPVPSLAAVAAMAPATTAAAPSPQAPSASPRAKDAPEAPVDELQRWFRTLPAGDKDPQVDAALLFAYFLQRREGKTAVGIGDLLRCCVRAGVDSRNFHRSLGVLSRRGLLEEVRHGSLYRISEQGIEAVEERLS